MSLHQISADVTLTEINCGNCGGTYAINERYRLQKEKKGGGWHCPYCEINWGYFGSSENAELEKELEKERKRKEWAEKDAKNQRALKEKWRRKERAQRAAKTRIKNRVKHGVCPCCNRTFENLAAHMKTKHPTYGEE